MRSFSFFFKPLQANKDEFSKRENDNPGESR